MSTYTTKNRLAKPAAGDTAWEAFARQVIGIYHRNAGHHEQALSELRQSRALASSIDDRSNLAVVRYDIGRCHFLQDQYEQARGVLREALAEFVSLNDRRWAAATRILLARVDTRLVRSVGEAIALSWPSMMRFIVQFVQSIPALLDPPPNQYL